MKFSCYGCTKRHIGCHGKCEEYKAQSEMDKERKMAIKREYGNAFIVKEPVEATRKRWSKRNKGYEGRGRR